VLEAKTSIQFAVASALIHGAMRDSNFRQIHDVATLALVRRVMIAQDDGYTLASPARQGATVRIQMQDGRAFEASATNVRPLDASGVRERFREVASRKLGKERTDEIERLAADLKGLTHFDTLARLFASPT
jgi:2-methylcitrate dehydratase PrpD